MIATAVVRANALLDTSGCFASLDDMPPVIANGHSASDMARAVVDSEAVQQERVPYAGSDDSDDGGNLVIDLDATDLGAGGFGSPKAKRLKGDCVRSPDLPQTHVEANGLQSDFRSVGPPALFRFPNTTSSCPVRNRAEGGGKGHHVEANGAATDKAIRMKIKRRKMATRNSGAKHEVVVDVQSTIANVLQPPTGAPAVENQRLLDHVNDDATPNAPVEVRAHDSVVYSGVDVTGSGVAAINIPRAQRELKVVNGLSLPSLVSRVALAKRPKNSDQLQSTIAETLRHPKVALDDQEAKTARDASTWVRTVATETDGDCLGLCEPGTSVALEGVVWNETLSGILVVNVSWRGRSYVGTLLDCSKYEFAPPRPADTQSAELEAATARTPKGRSGRRFARFHQVQTASDLTTKNGKNAKARTVGPSPAKAATTQVGPRVDSANASAAATPDDSSVASSTEMPPPHQIPATPASAPVKPPNWSELALMECGFPILYACPYARCSKKFNDFVSLDFHRMHAHVGDKLVDSESEDEEEAPPSAPVLPASPSKRVVDEVVSAVVKDQHARRRLSPLCPDEPLPLLDPSKSALDHLASIAMGEYERERKAAVMDCNVQRNASGEHVSSNKLTEVEAESLQNLFSVVSTFAGPQLPSASDSAVTDGNRAQSPAYSDISDDGNAPVLEREVDLATRRERANAPISVQPSPFPPADPVITQTMPSPRLDVASTMLHDSKLQFTSSGTCAPVQGISSPSAASVPASVMVKGERNTDSAGSINSSGKRTPVATSFHNVSTNNGAMAAYAQPTMVAWPGAPMDPVTMAMLFYPQSHGYVNMGQMQSMVAPPAMPQRSTAQYNGAMDHKIHELVTESARRQSLEKSKDPVEKAALGAALQASNVHNAAPSPVQAMMHMGMPPGGFPFVPQFFSGAPLDYSMINQHAMAGAQHGLFCPPK